jgi:hypothetical protein
MATLPGWESLRALGATLSGWSAVQAALDRLARLWLWVAALPDPFAQGQAGEVRLLEPGFLFAVWQAEGNGIGFQ